MRPMAFAWVASIALSSQAAVAADQTVTLRPGESVLAADGTRVGFDGVTGDSRCPKNVQCAWAGDAVVRLWLQGGDGPRQSLELHTLHTKTAPAAAPDSNTRVRLVRLAPEPVAGQAIAADHYVLTLTLGGSSSGEP